MQVLFCSAILLAFIYACVLLYYAIGWKQLKVYTPVSNAASVKISVIIPARNEEKNIGNCLESVLAQTYPSHLYEVIVVDDFSEDKTAEVIKSFAQVKLLQLKNFIDSPINSYKKKAIEIAVQQATGVLIVQTDADCIVTKSWLQTIADFYTEKKAKFIAMPVRINGSNTFIEMFQALDFMTLQGITAASVHKKVHSMCNGANMAFEKSAFEAVGGFAGVDGIASGDDMLLMHKINKEFPGDVYFLKASDVIVQTKPVSSVAGFLNQRIRWASKSGKYDDWRITAVLLVVYLFNCSMAALFIGIFFAKRNVTFLNIQHSIFSLFILLLIFKTVIELLFLFPVACFFKKQTLLLWFPVMQPFHILYTIVAGFLGKFGTYNWKGRNVK